ncbi:hypothetical protein D9758_015342 [Tetrapyrgos nigripes]|uniref:Brl1/Brr6 domain-containing protein n=1 Tax=Tetrapyrgos nigripes TaxID=182062 RepID=A0A8H5CL27_9AGAR|nr:hypothetical protein D9758_015342 [Tetrapyrgos nigripes]
MPESDRKPSPGILEAPLGFKFKQEIRIREDHANNASSRLHTAFSTLFPADSSALTQARAKLVQPVDVRYYQAAGYATQVFAFLLSITIPRAHTDARFGLCNVFLYVIWHLLAFLRLDIANSARLSYEDMKSKAAQCAVRYLENRCETPLPAVEEMCRAWQRCMNAQIGFTADAVEVIAGAANAFFGTLHFRALLAIAAVTVIYGIYCRTRSI